MPTLTGIGCRIRWWPSAWRLRWGWGEALHSWILNVFYKGPSLGGRALVTVGNAAVILGAAVGLSRLARNASGAERAEWGFAILLWPCLYFLFFLATRSSYALFTWYYLPVLPFLLLVVAVGWQRLAMAAPPAAAWGLLFAFLAYVPFQTWRQAIPPKASLRQRGPGRALPGGGAHPGCGGRCGVGSAFRDDRRGGSAGLFRAR